MKSDIKDSKLALEGKRRIEWADNQMKVLQIVRTRFKKQKPLQGLRISACLHVTSETANLMKTLKAGGADVVLCASNPLSTQDDVAASLVVHEKIPVFAITGEKRAIYYKHIKYAIDHQPLITMDDGADLVSAILKGKPDLAKNMLGSTEETTTGVIRLRSMEKDNVLKFPVIAVNDAETKHFFDNRYGTGQSTLDGIFRAVNRLIAGLTFVVSGYGQCGRGLAMRARGMGANVVVCEINPLKALEAQLDGYRVMPIADAAKIGDIFVTVTGCVNAIDTPHLRKMKDGAIVANSGHFDVEINLRGLQKISKSKKKVRDFVMQYTLPNGKHINILGEGRLINLAAAEGHPGDVMDMSFCNQALSAEYLAKKSSTLKPKVYSVPEHIDQNIARLKLKSIGVNIDTLTPSQETYLHSWKIGT